MPNALHEAGGGERGRQRQHAPRPPGANIFSTQDGNTGLSSMA